MSWITEFNRLEKIYIDNILDLIISFAELKEDKFSNIYTKACNLLYETTSTKIKNVEERIDRNSDEWKEIIRHMSAIGNELKNEYKKLRIESDVLERKFIKNSGRYIKRRELTLYIKRCNMLRNKVSVMIKSIQDNYAEELTDVLIQILYETGRLSTEEDKVKYELIQEENKKIEYKKIFDYKEMESLARKYGYEKVRTSGDHMMYKNKDTNKLVPIVAHDIQYGLSRQIQKQLYRNSIIA